MITDFVMDNIEWQLELPHPPILELSWTLKELNNLLGWAIC